MRPWVVNWRQLKVQGNGNQGDTAPFLVSIYIDLCGTELGKIAEDSLERRRGEEDRARR